MIRPDKSLVVLLGIAAIAAAMAPKANAAAAQVLSPNGISSKGLAFLKGEEGFSATAYKDGSDAIRGQLYSIGYGHQIVPGDGLNSTSVITPDRAEALLLADIASRVAAVKTSVLAPLNQNQFDALISFAYNIGISGFKGSEVVKALNRGDYKGAKDVWTKYWTKSDGKTNPVLVARRQREAALFAS